MLAALNFSYADHSWGRYEGPNCEIFRQQLADYHDTEFVTLCQSGTFATELALRGLRVGSGDEVILAGYDFGGNFAAIEATGAKPVLVDIEETNWNLDPRLAAAAVGERTKAIIVSHLHGGSSPCASCARCATSARSASSKTPARCRRHCRRPHGRHLGRRGRAGSGGSQLRADRRFVQR